MIFILLLIASTVAIAGSAAYFSVYGLANTFSGVFWSVVVMGASLEAGKLVAASFLYRYWDRINLVLRSYLVAGVAALMVLTSLGIFGYLSSGYQQDILPLKQKTEQINLLTDEKTRALARKKQIDDLLAGGPSVSNVNRSNGNIDPNAARAIRETTRSREALVKQYKAEQEQTTKRVAELDKELLTLKQEIIKTEAHIGPITYIAKAMSLDSDDATKYLILVIIFAFDPMAVALTLAVNVALRLRKEDEEREDREEEELFGHPLPIHQEPVAPPPPVEPTPEPDIEPVVQKLQVEDQRGSLADVDQTFGQEDRGSLDGMDYTFGQEPRGSLDDVDQSFGQEDRGSLDEVDHTFGEEQHGLLDEVDYSVEPEPEAAPPEAAIVHEDADEPPPEVLDPPASNEIVMPTVPVRQFRPYPASWKDTESTPDKMRELINHHKFLKARKDNGDTLTEREEWEMASIEEVLRKNGVDIYL